jgi:hypothetical protein
MQINSKMKIYIIAGAFFMAYLLCACASSGNIQTTVDSNIIAEEVTGAGTETVTETVTTQTETTTSITANDKKTSLETTTVENSVTSTETASDDGALTGDTDVLAVYDAVLGAARTPEMFAAPDEIILDYYGINASDYTDAVFMMSVDGLLADEIVIVRAVDEEASGKIAERLNKRLKTKADEARTYSPEQFAVIENSMVTRDGLWTAMLVSPEAEKMREAYKNAILK